MLQRDALNALAREIGRARRTLTVERAVTAALWPVLAVAGWMAVALSGLPALLPPLAATLLGFGVLIGLAVFAVRAARSVRRPSDLEARTRLVADAGLERGALDALEDNPARLDPVAMALWRREQARAAEAVSRASAGKPRFALAAADPWRVRFALPVLLLFAALLAGPHAPERLAQAFYPDPGPLLGDKPMAIEAWVTPASYTGGAPVSLSDRVGATVETAPSPEATVRVTGPVGAPWLVYQSAEERRRIAFTRAADGAWEARMALHGRGDLRVVRFHTKARWRIRPAVDAAPEATLVGAVRIGEDDKVVVGWLAKDDYGVAGLALRITPVDPPPGLKKARPVDTEIEAPAGDPASAEGEAVVDLAEHPYAGMKVNVQVVARDSLGQEGVSEPASATLPEKIFLQPLARVAIEIRKLILHERRAYAKQAPFMSPRIRNGPADLFGIRTDDEDPRLTRAPAAIRRAGRMIDAVTMAPQDGYFRDQAVYAGFRLARSTLDYAREIEDTNEAADILWHVALRAEYGDSADARRALDEAQRRLSEAIRNGASPEEIARLSEALAQATQTYLQALAQEAVREGKKAETEEDSAQQQSLSRDDIQKMLEEVQRRAEAGDTAGAQALLQQLAQMLNNLEVKLANGKDGDGKDSPPTELEQTVDGLSEQIGRQRELNDDTAREESERQQGGQSAQERQQNQQQQQQLGERQEELSRQLDEAQKRAEGAGAKDGGKDLNEAGEAMDRAARALRQGDLEEAGRQQQKALRDLRRGAERLSSQAQAEREGRTGEASRKEQPGETDPLGRQTGGAGDTGDETTVPSASERQRAREILDEVRRRAQDNRRPETEREYLRRLLERFTGA